MGIFSNKTDFGRKLKTLKFTYELSNSDLSRYCTIVNESNISKGSISLWENGRSTPSIDSALLIADIFAVDLNWLISHDNYPEKPIYNETRLEFLESNIISRSKEYIIRGEVYPFPYLDVLNEDYLDIERRRLNYTYEARANIIFLMYVIDFEWQRYIKSHMTEFKSLDEITLKSLAMRIWDFLMTVPGDIKAIREAAKKLNTIMETKKPLYKVRW